jgi:hypothetical protein
MKAILFPKYGSPDVLQLAEVEKPIPKENQLLIKVVAAAANPLGLAAPARRPVSGSPRRGIFQTQKSRADTLISCSQRRLSVPKGADKKARDAGRVQ